MNFVHMVVSVYDALVSGVFVVLWYRPFRYLKGQTYLSEDLIGLKI